jgi:hypothetical protein
VVEERREGEDFEEVEERPQHSLVVDRPRLISLEIGRGDAD